MTDRTTGDQSPTEDSSMDDTKAKMREALARKKEQGHPTAAGRRNTGPIHENDVVGGRRMFRRKSGG